MNNSEGESRTIFQSDFIPHINKWGRRLNLLGVLMCFGPCIALAVMGIFPPWDALVLGLSVVVSMEVPSYIGEPISYFGVLGIPGTYMAFLSGNIGNLRVPASAVSQSAAGVEEGSEEGTIIATIGIAVSTFVNITILLIGIIVGSKVLSMLPPVIANSLDLLIPALFAALAANYMMNSPKIAIIGFPIIIVMVLLSQFGLLSFLPSFLESSLPILVSVFGTMGVAVKLAKKNKL